MTNTQIIELVVAVAIIVAGILVYRRGGTQGGVILLVVGRLGMLGKPAKEPVQAMLDGHLDWLEGEIATRDWFAGDEFTAADIMMSFPLEASRSRGGLDESRPHLIDWLERIHARPAYGEALAKGGAYAYA